MTDSSPLSVIRLHFVKGHAYTLALFQGAVIISVIYWSQIEFYEPAHYHIWLKRIFWTTQIHFWLLVYWKLFPRQRSTIFMNDLMLGGIGQVLNNKQNMHQLSELESDRQESCHLPLGNKNERQIITATWCCWANMSNLWKIRSLQRE